VRWRNTYSDANSDGYSNTNHNSEAQCDAKAAPQPGAETLIPSDQ
jgi:hypothetical protein